MKKVIILLGVFILSFSYYSIAQHIVVKDSIKIEDYPEGESSNFFLKITENAYNEPISVPVIVIRGRNEGPVFGITAAIHGNELNGIGVIHELIGLIDPDSLSGTIIAIPGLNAVSLVNHERRFVDEEDLNRNFPGKSNGNRSQQYVWQINQKILTKIDFLMDLHTASFGRVNSLYVRADMSDPLLFKLAMVQDADIILNNKGVPSATEQIAATRTMRAEAVLKGVPCITIEYGNPQVFQEDLISRGVTGMMNSLKVLEMYPGDIIETPTAVRCKKSYWTFVEEGGLLTIHVDNAEKVKKGQIIATLKDPFGKIIKQYESPEDGIIIGKSSNPVNMSGGRIIHLGILE